jgi:hypothetical protein
MLTILSFCKEANRACSIHEEEQKVIAINMKEVLSLQAVTNVTVGFHSAHSLNIKITEFSSSLLGNRLQNTNTYFQVVRNYNTHDRKKLKVNVD